LSERDRLTKDGGRAEQEAEVRTNLLLGATAVAALITGAIAQTSSQIERIKDPAAQQKASRDADLRGATSTAQNTGSSHVSIEPKKKVRTVYPNTQNAEQAVKQSRGAGGLADAMAPGDVTPLPTAQQPAAEPTSSPAQRAQSPQPTVQATGAQSSAPATPTSQNSPSSAIQSTQAATPSAPTPAAQQPNTLSSTTQSKQAASPSAPAPAVQQPSTPPAPPSTVTSTQQTAPTATAESNTSAPSQPLSSPPSLQSSSTGIVSLNTEQQTSVGQAIARHNVKPVTNVNFSIAVGTKVPTPVQLRALPSDLTTFIPQYRGYSYFVVEEQIVIVDPGAHEIVAIVPYTGTTATAQALEISASKPRESVEASTPKARPVKETSKPKPRSVVQKPMTTRSVNLNTEEKSVTPRHASERRMTTEKSVMPRHTTEQKRTTRTVSKREYRGREDGPRTVTIEELQEPVYREAPRRGGFFGLFRSNDDDDDY
jgi:hypothetical protein